MITPEAARKFALEHFPRGPEALVEELGVDVRESQMSGCDGWCLVRNDTAIIRINSRLGMKRRRFTLAHELGHLILGIPGIVGESYEQMLSSDLDDEKKVNELASEILLPESIVRHVISDLPVVSIALKRLAKKANVSELAAAIRVCNLAAKIGLVNASVVFFDSDGAIRWQWSKTLSMTEQTAIQLLEDARRSAPEVYRFERDEGDVIVGSIIENSNFGSATLFVQLLPKSLAINVSHHERKDQLERVLFENDSGLRNRVSGFLGGNKVRLSKLTKSQAIQDFWRHYEGVLRDTIMNSDEGREYISIRIKEWFQT